MINEKIEYLDADTWHKLFDPVSKIIYEINNTKYPSWLESSYRFPAKITEHRFNWISKLIRYKKYIDELKIAAENSEKSKNQMLTVRKEYYIPRFHFSSKMSRGCSLFQFITYKSESESEIQSAKMDNTVHQQKYKQLADKRKNKWFIMKNNKLNRKKKCSCRC